MSTDNQATVTNEFLYGVFPRYRCVDNPDADKVLTKQWWSGFIAGAIGVEIALLSYLIGAEIMKRHKN